MRKHLTCLAVALVFVGGLMALMRPSHCPVDRAAFGRIEKGMTRAEVRSILGGPQGEYPTRAADYYSAEGVLNGSERWYRDDGVVCVVFDPVSHATVIDMAFAESAAPPPSPLELARWRLRKLKEAWLP